MGVNNPAGSQWRKWDLHVHTPMSISQHYGGNTPEAWERFFKDLEALPKEFKVLGINDYIFIDGYERVLKAKKEGRLKNIDLILPVIELRLDKFAGVVKLEADGKYSAADWNRINLHVIFDELDPEVIRQQFLNALVPTYHLVPDAEQFKKKWQAVITRESIEQLGKMIIEAAPEDKRAGFAGPLQEGFNNLCCNLDKIREALDRHDLRDRHLTAVGKTEWASMKWEVQSIAEKRNTINQVDLVFTASETPAACDAARKKLKESNVNAKLIDCSDAHAFSDSENKDRIGNCFSWIKADPTFQGLKHAVAEFDQRVFTGDVPPKLGLVEANRTKYISSLAITKRPGSTLEDSWFNISVPLNHDLVAIIGNKGSGKSALADVAALVGNTKTFGSFSFLNDQRFRDPRSKLAANFVGTLHWADGNSTSQDLHRNPDPASVERVKYLPQSYLETLCNELAVTGSSRFDAELRKIIYTHVPAESQLGFSGLDDLLAFKVAELEREKARIGSELEKINAAIIATERKLLPSFKLNLEEQLRSKRFELDVLESHRPEVVEDPLASSLAETEAVAATARLASLDETLKELAGFEATVRRVKGEATRRSILVSKILQSLDSHAKGHQQFLIELDSMLEEVDAGVSAKAIAKLTVDRKPLAQLAVQMKELSDAQDAILNDRSDEGLMRRRQAAEAEVAAIRSQLDEKQRLFLLYKEQLSQWEASKTALIGDESKPNTIEWLKSELRQLADLPNRRKQLQTDRVALVREIHAQLNKIAQEYRTMYEPVQDFVKAASSMEMPLPLDFNVSVAQEGFQDFFLERINRQTRGSFAGVEESETLVTSLLKEVNFSDTEEVVSFVEKIDDLLHFDRRPNATVHGPLAITEQLRKGQTVEDLYRFVFGLSYLQPKYSLTFGGQEISQLSPGERGLLLLVFYLLVDKDDIPLVIDQPEENLDNQTIYKILVVCIKEAKRRRQVVMVTHNPNLAVVCDAEQIIYASCDKNAKKFAYDTGAIESPTIKAHVLEILEGTRPAFENRSLKYSY